MEKKFDKIYYRVINEGLLGSVVQGVGTALKNNAGEIIRGIDPNKSALPSVAKAVGQIPGAIGSLKPKWGTPLDIEKHKQNPNAFKGTKIFKTLNKETKEIVTATVTDVSNLKTQGYFVATLADPNYIVIVDRKNSSINNPTQNKTQEYVVRKDYFNNIKTQFDEYIKDFLLKNNINQNIETVDIRNLFNEIKQIENDLNLKNKNLKLLQNKKQQNNKKQNIKQKIFNSISTVEDEIDNLKIQYKEKQKDIEDKKKFDSEVKNFMEKNLQYVPKKQNTFVVTTSEAASWFYAQA
jgi:hypothetical protein